MSDAHTRNRLRWLDALSVDPSISMADFRVAFRVSTYINRDLGYAWPSVATLAAEVGLSERAVQYSLRKLTSTGALETVSGGGRGKTNRYRLASKTPNGAAPFKSENPASDCTVSPAERVQTDARKGANGRTKGCSPLHPISFIETSEEPSERYTADGFAEFWDAYPRRVGKLAAQRAFAKALKATTAAEIIAGARRYAEQRRGQDSKFTKHPTTWLNGGCWTDETEPTGAAHTAPVSVALEYAEGR